jgi:hypothetical protein
MEERQRKVQGAAPNAFLRWAIPARTHICIRLRAPPLGGGVTFPTEMLSAWEVRRLHPNGRRPLGSAGAWYLPKCVGEEGPPLPPPLPGDVFTKFEWSAESAGRTSQGRSGFNRSLILMSVLPTGFPGQRRRGRIRAPYRVSRSETKG